MIDTLLFKNTVVENGLVILGSFLIISLIKLTNRSFLVKTPIYHIYDNVIDNFNSQVLSFASFLDEYEKSFISNPEHSMRINECLSSITNTFCYSCKKRSLCLKEKTKMYTFIKSSIAYGKDILVKGNFIQNKEFLNFCPYSDKIISLGNQLKNKYHITKESSTSAKLLEGQIKGITNTLRQYAVNLSIKKEINLYKFMQIKDFMRDYGYNLIIFNLKKTSIDDFLIEIGIVIEKNEISLIKKNIESILETSITITTDDIINGISYLHIFPKMNYNIDYGMASLAKENESFRGDSTYAKKYNGFFVGALSDGMGSGYSAHLESKLTIEIVEKITNLDLNTHTIINMLNTFYSLRDNMDQYATLDLIKINQSNGETVLYKMGSATSFLIRDHQIVTIENKNLPCGMNDLISYEEFVVKDNDLIVIVSDGITDYIDEKALDSLMLASLYKSSQKTACEIIDLASNGNKNRDDISAVVIKIEKITS